MKTEKQILKEAENIILGKEKPMMFFYHILKKDEKGYVRSGWIEALGGKDQAVFNLLVNHPELTPKDISIEMSMTKQEFDEQQKRPYQGD